MHARRARFLGGSMLFAGLIATAWAAPVAAADCALTAPAYVNVGTQIEIDGAGFPASTTVEVSLAVEGGTRDEFTLSSDAAGAVHLAFTPEDIDIGVTTIQATAGSDCTAEVTYTVLAAGQTPPPAPVDSSGTGAAPGAPATDTGLLVVPGGAAGAGQWGLAFILVASGCLGLLLSRPRKRR